ncbi:hypothetical protein Y032_0662g1294 [Ancylostoma ceylanicum]|uniref:Uncharacterized protein n=1 Tax=Ancylostoma ceylanicum TaxID=53326 RepID=A0A016WI86_9BILA|nr:hypothetical protein Y032_0662g1294 [Ancylostoma ceylanicum]
MIRLKHYNTIKGSTSRNPRLGAEGFVAGRKHTPRWSTLPRLPNMIKRAFISRLFHAISSPPMSLPSRKTQKFGDISKARISAGAVFKKKKRKWK